MAGMGGINSYNSIYSTASQLPGFGGLASGLDRDTLIEQMTSGTRVKIAKMNQKIDLVKWTQDSIRGITDKMYDFSNKYISFSSSTNLTSSKLFAKSQITPVGENSKYIGISGNATGKNMFSILGVKQMAQDAKITSNDRVSDSAMTTKPINFVSGQDFSKIAGDTITFETGKDEGRKTYKITIPTEDKDGNKFHLDSAEGVAKAMNYAIEQYNADATVKLTLKVEVTGASEDGSGKLKFINTSDVNNGNEIRIASSTGDIQKELGIEAPADGGDDAKFTIGAGKSVESTKITKDNLVGNKPMHELLKGAELTFDYNGKTEKIVFKDEDLYEVDGDGNVLTDKPKITSGNDFQKLLQSKMDAAFGKGRITVSLGQEGGAAQSLKMTTTTPDGKVDTSSVLTLKSGSSSLLGADGALGISKGATNRINMGATLKESGIKGLVQENGKYKMTINGVDFDFDENATMNDVMKKINESDAGVTISYQAMSDKFTIESKESGASGKVQITGELGKALFGADAVNKEVRGQDAIVSIKYDGQDEVIDIVRDSNGFTVEGLEVSIKGTFGEYDDQGKIKEDVANTVTFDATIDSQKTVDVVKDMVKDINELIELVNKEMTTKPNRDYQPLTAEQKKEMSEDEIKKWEEKAKEGLLFNDSDLRGLSNALRFSIPANLRADLEKVGISISKDYKDNGKLVLDEEKLKTALEKDPQHVRELFNGNGSKDNKGLMGNIKASLDRYGATTGADKGILVRRAGSTHAPTSMLQNQMLTQINEYNRIINDLNARLKNEQDRYIKQFTSLETLISQMNSQSSYFAGMVGGY